MGTTWVNVCCWFDTAMPRPYPQTHGWMAKSFSQGKAQGMAKHSLGIQVWVLIVCLEDVHHNSLLQGIYGEDCPYRLLLPRWANLASSLLQLCYNLCNYHAEHPRYCSFSIREPRPPGPAFLCVCAFCLFFICSMSQSGPTLELSRTWQ